METEEINLFSNRSSKIFFSLLPYLLMWSHVIYQETLGNGYDSMSVGLFVIIPTFIVSLPFSVIGFAAGYLYEPLLLLCVFLGLVYNSTNFCIKNKKLHYWFFVSAGYIGLCMYLPAIIYVS